MKPLELYQFVRQEIPEATDNECQMILSKTHYPFCSLERLQFEIQDECLSYRKKKAMQ